MAQKNYIESVSILHPVCCGIDVHKNKITSTLVYEHKGETYFEVRECSAFTDELTKLRDWLLEYQCPVVAMESTGIYWRPVHNILENHIKVVLVNARHYKNVPGRKTDIGDSQWLAELLRYGLVKGSFIPPAEVRRWRDLTNQRKQFVRSESDFRRRVQKLFETANIKIDSVVSDIFGVSGRNLMETLLAVPSETITLDMVKSCLRGRLIKKADELFRAIKGFFNDHHRFLLRSYLDVIDLFRGKIDTLDLTIQDVMKKEKDLIRRLDDIPGLGPVAIATILSLIGPTLKNFSSSAALCSWAGVCPGNNESAGKRRSGRSPVRKHPLKEILVEVAWAAIKVSGSFYKDKYYRLKARRGAKRAIVGIAHRILKAIYNIVKDGQKYRELGDEYLAKRNEKLKFKRLKKQAKQFGFTLTALA